jgi:DNA helicase-2/ATP-dependent DNA helicase PcrA
LWTNDKQGEPIKLYLAWDDKEEARIIADEIENLQQIKKVPSNDIAILVRAGFQTRSFEECFISRNIAYKVIGGLRFYERMEIRDIISYIRLVAQNDDSLALERIINIPKRGIGQATMQAIHQIAKENSTSMFYAVCHMLKNNLFKNKLATTLQKFTDEIIRWGSLVNNMSVAELVSVIINESGYLSMWKLENTVESQGRIENIKELLRALDEFESIEEFLEHVSLVSDIDSADHRDMVNIMTLHAAKGLEFNSVFLPGWEEGTFPNQRSMNENGKSGVEEERRLAYVGITRAKERLYILAAANRRIYGQYQSSTPSRFIDELPTENIDKINLNNGYNYTSNIASNHKITNYQKDSSNTDSGDTDSGDKLGIGKRIFHIKFGYGVILKKEGNQLEISFKKAGIKKVIDQYVQEA